MPKNLSQIAKQKKIKYFLISFVDLFGVLRSKLVPAQAISEMQKNGAGFAGLGSRILKGFKGLKPIPTPKVAPQAATQAATQTAKPIIRSRPKIKKTSTSPLRTSPTAAQQQEISSIRMTGKTTAQLKKGTKMPDNLAERANPVPESQFRSLLPFAGLFTLPAITAPQTPKPAPVATQTVSIDAVDRNNMYRRTTPNIYGMGVFAF